MFIDDVTKILRRIRKTMKKLLIFTLSLLLIVVFAIPVMAYHLEPTPEIKTQIYGTVNFQNEYRWIDQGEDSTAEDKSELRWDNSNTFGISASYKNFFGIWETGFASSIYPRLHYGTWTINPDMSLTIGQQYMPDYWWTNSDTDAAIGGTGYGVSYVARSPAIRFNYKGAYISGVTVNKVSHFPDSVTTKKVPRIYVGYDTMIGNHLLGGGLGYQTYKEESAATGFDDNVQSWHVFLHGQIAVTDVYDLKFNGWYGVNSDEFGILGLNGVVRDTDTGTFPEDYNVNSNRARAQLNDAGDNLIDTKTFAAMFQIKANKGKVRPMGGVGFSTIKNSQYKKHDAKIEYWVGAQVDVWEADNKMASIYIVPEFHVFDLMDDPNGKDEGSATYAGLRWKLTF
jgi:hypothetical protein